MPKRRQQQPAQIRARRQHRWLQAATEALEPRRLFSTDFLLSGNQLTTITNGSASSPVTVANVNNVQIAASGADNVTVENFAGAVTVTGGGGGDTLVVYAGGGGSVTFADPSAPGNTDQVILRAPTTSADNVTASATAAALSTGDTIHYGAGVAAVSLVGQLFSNGDALTVTGAGGQTITVGASSVQLGGSAPTLYYSTFNGLTVNGGAGDGFNLVGDSEPTTLNAGSGADAFLVQTNAVALSLNGGSGLDSYTVQSNSGLLTASGGTGGSNFTVLASSSSMILGAGGGANSFTVNSNSASLTINGNGTSNSVTVNGNSSTITAYGGAASTDSYTVNSTTGGVTLAGGTGTSAYTITAPTIAPVTVTGSTSGTGLLTFDGNANNNAFSVTPGALNAGSGATVSFTHVTGLALNGIAGNDSFLVNGDSVPTTLTGGTGKDTFNLQNISAALAVNTGSGASTLNVASNAPLLTNDRLTNITGPLTITGDGADTLNVLDTADTAPRAAALTATTLTGLGTAGITYTGLATLNLKLGSGGNTLAIASTALAAVTNINTGTGSNTVSITSGGVTDGIAGNVNLTGPGTDALTVDDSANTSGKTVVLLPTTITGLGAGAIGYTGDASVALHLGSGGDAITVTNTAATTPVSLTVAGGVNTLNLLADASPFTYASAGTGDTDNLRSVSAATSITNTGGHSLINLGSLAPAAGGTLAGLAAALTVTGSSTDTLIADDTADATARTGALSATKLTGLGLAAVGVTYANLADLELNLGTGSTNFTLTNTSAGTATHITGNTGADTFTLDADSSATTITSGAGSDALYVQSIAAATSLITGAGVDTILLGSTAPTLGGVTGNLAATLTVLGGGSTTLSVDDTGDTNGTSSTITSTAVTGLTGGSGVIYTGLSALNVSLGNGGGNTATLASTAPATATTLSTGAIDTVYVLSTAGPTIVNAATSTDIYVGNHANAGHGVTSTIAGPLTVTAVPDGTVGLVLEDNDDTTAHSITLSATSAVGLSPATISFTGINNLQLLGDSGADQITVADTIAGATNISAPYGTKTVTVEHTSGPTSVAVSGSTVAVQNIAAATEIFAQYAGNSVTIGAPLNGGRTLAGINATLTLDGNPSTATVDDSADPAVHAGAQLTASAITGFSTGEIDYSNLAALHLLLGATADTLTIANTAASTTVTGGGGATLNVRGDAAALSLTPGPSSNVNVGDLGQLNGVASPLLVTGDGTTTLNLNNANDPLIRNGTLSASTLTGLGNAAITYTGLADLNLSLGNAADTLLVTNTAAGTATAVTTGTHGNTLNVRATTGPLAITSGGADAVTVGSAAPAASVTSTIAGAVTVTGLGTDTLTVNDAADATNAAGSLSTTAVMGLGAANINYTGLSHLTVDLGAGADTFTLDGTVAGTATTINGGGGNNTLAVLGTSGITQLNTTGTVILGSSAPAGGNVTGITGPVALSGDGHVHLFVQDAADPAAATGALSATNLTLGPVALAYSGVGTLAIALGSAADALTINSTAAATPVTLNGGAGNDAFTLAGTSSPLTLDTGNGNDAVNVQAIGATATITNPGGTDIFTLGSPAGVLDGIAAPLTLTGSGTDALIIDDAGSTLAKTGTLTSTTLLGLNTAGVTYTGMASLALSMGSGGNTFGITSDTIPTTLNAGTGDDQLTISDPNHTTDTFAAPLTVNGGGSATLTLNDTNSTQTKSVLLTNTAVIGLNPAGVHYAALGSLQLNLGDGNDAVLIQSTAADTTTTLAGNTAGQSFRVAPANGSLSTALAGPINLTGGGSDPLTIDDTADATNQSVTITANQIAGMGSTVGYAGMNSLTALLGSGNDTVAVTGLSPILARTALDGGTGSNYAAVNLPGDLPGHLALTHFQNGVVTVAGNIAGSLTTDGNLSSVHVLGGLLPGSVLNVAGVLKQIEIDGVAAGSTTVGSLQGVIEPSVTPAADGTIFTLDSGGITRTIREVPANAQPLVGSTFSVVYDATTGEPQAAVRINGSTSGQRYDLLFDAPAGSTFSLSRVDSTNDAATDVRNVVIDGDILGNVTPAEAAYFGYAAGVAGGVQLPVDHLAAVSAQGNFAAGAIRSATVQGYSFAQLIGLGGVATDAPTIAVSAHSEKLLLSALMVNPATGKPYATIVPPTEPLLAAAGTTANHAVLFAGRDGLLSIDPSGFVLWDRDPGQIATAETDFSGRYNAGRETLTTLAWQGSGGSVQTRRLVSNITSTGALGDVILTAGRAEQLQSITAPGMEGSLNLFGGKLLGTIQTTGDLGASDGSSTIALQLGPSARIVSGGNLFSDVAIAGNFTGTVAAGEDLDGSIDVTGGGRSTGQIIAFGAVNGSVHIAGSFSGQIAAGSASGIHGSIAVDHGISRGGAVLSEGEIGDAAAGTSLTTPSVAGEVAAAGAVRLVASHVPPASHVVQAAGGSATPLAGLWSDAGVPVTLDDMPGDLAGLSLMQSRLKQLARPAA